MTRGKSLTPEESLRLARHDQRQISLLGPEHERELQQTSYRTISKLMHEQTQERVRLVIVFGSNLAGRHGAGAALYARKHHGAIYGQGEGLQGDSYAIPTKDQRLATLPLSEIAKSVRRFLAFAVEHPELQFQVTRIGCGLAGYTDEQMAPMFRGHPANCNLDPAWLPFTTSHSLNEGKWKVSKNKVP
jgi:hypothetical protein